MPGGGLHLASSEARRRDGLLRRNLHYILTAIVAVVASVALAVPSVYADPANNAAEEPAQTTAAASDVEPLADGGDNSWQIVKCASKNEDGCTTTSTDENVRVHKWVTPTNTENVFNVHLSIDKRDDEVSEVMNATAFLENNPSSGSTVGGVETCNGQCQIQPGGNKEFYYQIIFTDENGEKHYSEIIHVTGLKQQPNVAALSPGKSGDQVLVAWSIKDPGTGTGKTAEDYAKLQVKYGEPGYETVFGSVTTVIKFETADGSAPVTDKMGAYIAYEDSAADSYVSDGASNVKFNSGTNTLSWTPAVNAGATADEDGWINNVAELQYQVRLDVAKEGFVSSGFPTDNPNPVYDTNASATLNYTVTTTKKTGDTVTEESQTADVVFQQPQVRGLLYDLVATKTDGSDMLNGATFGLYAADGETPVGKDGSEATEENPQYTVTSGQDDMAPGQIVFTGLPWGTYMVKEISAPTGYKPSDDTWTELLCYTTSREGLVKSEVNNSHAMKERSTAFINHKPTPVDPTKRKYVKDNGDGTYDLSLDVKGQVDTTVHKIPVNILYILDTSFSMTWDMDGDHAPGEDGDEDTRNNSYERMKAAQAAIDALNGEDALGDTSKFDTRYAMLTFNEKVRETVKWTGNVSDLSQAMPQTVPQNKDSSGYGSGTNYADALSTAQGLISTAPAEGDRSDAQTIVVFLTDGQPNWPRDGEDNLAYAQEQAVEAAEGIACDRFYVFGVGETKKGEYRANLDGIADAANAESTVYVATQQNDLVDEFAKISADITSVDCSDVKITDTLSQYAEFAGDPAFRLTVTDGGGKVVVDNRTVDENGHVSFDAADGTTVTATVTCNLDEKSFNLVFPEEYVLDNGWTYTITTVIQPTYDARAEYQNGRYNAVGDPGTDAEGNYTSSDKPGFQCNDRATLTYTSDGVQQEKEYAHPVIQVPVVVPGLVETKTVHGDDAEASAFSFTVKPTGNNADEAATIAGLVTRHDENCIYESGTYTCTSPSIQSDRTATVHTGNRLVFTTADIGKTYTYEYEETMSDAGWHSTGVNAWKVQIEVQKDEAKGGVKAVVTVFSRDSANDEFAQVSGYPVSYTDGQQTQKIQIGFENTFVSVSSLPLTGGRSTARTLLRAPCCLPVAVCCWWPVRRGCWRVVARRKPWLSRPDGPIRPDAPWGWFGSLDNRIEFPACPLLSRMGWGS